MLLVFAFLHSLLLSLTSTSTQQMHERSSQVEADLTDLGLSAAAARELGMRLMSVSGG